MISKTLHFARIVCLIVIFHNLKFLLQIQFCFLIINQHLGDNICGRFNSASINISYKTHKCTKSPIVLQNLLANVQKNLMCLSNGIMRLITRISKVSFCLYSVKIVCIRTDSVLKSCLFFANCFHFLRCNTFKQKTAVCNLRNGSQFHFVQTRTETFL